MCCESAVPKKARPREESLVSKSSLSFEVFIIHTVPDFYCKYHYEINYKTYLRGPPGDKGDEGDRFKNS